MFLIRFFCVFTCFFSAVFAFSQKKNTITGTVLSSDDLTPIAGVTVKLKNVSKATQTDALGNFQLSIDEEFWQTGILQFTYVGFTKFETKLNGRKVINTLLQRSLDGLQEVVVTNSYSRAKRKEEVVGSIVTISEKDLQANRPIETLDKMLEGLAAGVQVVPSTELGTPVKINIRGQNSLSSLSTSNDAAQLTTSTQPLFIVDGVPIMEPQRGDIPSLSTNQQLLNPLASINPDDIESISVLKDAAATSIYGNNASNGVIIITTKRGKAGKTRVNVGFIAGQSQSINRIKWLDGKQYADLLYETYINEGRSPFDAERLVGSRDINTNWFELTNRIATFQNADFDISGGNENTTFRFSASYLNQMAIQKGNDYQRLNLNLRIDHKMGNKWNMSISLLPSFTTKNGLNAYSNVPIAPNVPVFNADGSYYAFSNLGVPNPLAVLAQNTNYHEGGAINGNIRLEYRPIEGLTIAGNLGTNSSVNKQNVFFSPLNATGSPLGGRAVIYDRQDFSWIGFTNVTYAPKFKNTYHKLDIIAGFEAQHQGSKLLTGQGTGFTYYRLNELSNAAVRNAASSRNINRTTSWYGQTSYSYNSKYFLNISGRLDAASVFGASVNSTINGAVGAGWIISKEQFFPETKW
ncbi:MAG: SusC/RagA family TonB-linked outer membrane protein, partial [Chitinophagaceae bacterium]